MNPDLLVSGFLQYMVFLFSTTCHEAAHSLIAKWGGDTTALEGGQVSLSPLPHIRREPFGMIVIPLLGLVTGSGLIGWASAPYNPKWAHEHPRRAAWMSAAGPAANFSLVLISGVLLKIGLAAGYFTRVDPSFMHLVGARSNGGLHDGVATILSVFFSLNVLLGTFNLLPFPPLDGYSILGVFTTDNGARRLEEWRRKMGMFSILGLILAWQFFDTLYDPVMGALLYAFFRYS